MTRLFTSKQREAIHGRAKGRCEKCSAVLKLREGEYDHIIEYVLTRDTSVENGQLLCKPCHRNKTSARATDLAKVKRIRAKHTGTWAKSKAKIPNRPFSPTRIQENSDA